MWRKIVLSLMLTVIAGTAGPMLAVRAASLPPGFSDAVFESDPDGNPTAMEFAPDGRLFVLDQGGDVWVIKNGARLTTPFVSLTVNTDGERGLLGIAFDPNFSSNHFVYLYHTTDTPTTHNQITRYTDDNDVAATGSALDIFNLPDLGPTNHNGGSMHFGSDGKLYVGVGENGDGTNSQSKSTTLGKMLRINTDGTIPTNNPFFGSTTGDNRAIWAMGLRNPYTFGIDPGDGKIFIDDVGESSWEEIDLGASGANYGWPDTEGTFNQSTHPNFTEPITTYSHSDGCAITGGSFYRPSSPQFPASYVGKYFFADLCGGWIRMLNPSNAQVSDFDTSTDGGNVVDIDTGPDGNLYYLSRGDGSVHVLTYSNTPPSVTITKPVSTLLYQAGSSIAYSANATDVEQSSFPNSAYSWQVDFYDGANPSTPVPMTLTHPVGKSGSFKVPNSGDKSTDVWYRFTVTVTDAGGLTAQATQDVHPRISNLSFATVPANQDISVDGTPQTTPFSFDAVAGMKYDLSVPLHVSSGGSAWQFKMWKPGGKIAHSIVAPAKDTTFTATYIERQVLNGSFETASRNKPKSWRLTRLTSADGVDCGLADTLSCSLHLVGGGSAKTVSQLISLSGSAGDTYRLDFAVQGQSASSLGFTVQLLLQNRDHSKTLTSVDLSPADGTWTPENLSVSSTKDYTRLQINIIANAGATGDAWFDSFAVTMP